MKLEYLVLVKNDDSFCNSKKAFIDFLKVDSLISINGQKLSYKRSLNSKVLITVKFRVETGNIPSNKERFFLIALENSKDELIDEFAELGSKIKEISKRINPESTIVNTLWDDVGRSYAYQAYPLINEVENLMRKLISKFMLINVGMNWSKESIHPDLFKKIENYEEEELNLNDLYKLDFIHLSQVLFQKKRDISLDELDRILSKTKFSAEDQEKIRKYIPVSNWEKYFSALLGEDAQGLEKKWEILYKLRNKVAHNRFVVKEDFGKIKGLTSEIGKILGVAINKLSEIDLDEQDRESIIHSYHSESPIAYGYLAEKAVAEYYVRQGFIVEPSTLNEMKNKGIVDLTVKTKTESIAVEVKTITAKSISFLKIRINRASQRVGKALNYGEFTHGEVVIVLRDYQDDDMPERMSKRLEMISDQLDPRISIVMGYLNESDEFEVIAQ
ncbi:hypothetical protein PE36_12307 [Moritella sp. PE36]|uniref:HEPN domain-containing protein n=1 Tax=Moritella sp. PE36 TaxID=58051 RepID=UPI000156968D|nr:HEPN domain-containing protein [Moritella sp. PE36]EDM64884.1 hypothetical protein PE36_12307 [Moritella sp. PE36]